MERYSDVFRILPLVLVTGCLLFAEKLERLLSGFSVVASKVKTEVF